MFSSSRLVHTTGLWSKAALSLAGISLLSSSSATTATCEKKQVDNHRELIAVYLKPESKVMMEKFLSSRGLKDHTVDYVAIHSSAKESTSYVFRPLFGERAAFRLKGLLTLENGEVVGIGRVSNMVGELKDDRVVAMPVFKKPKNATTEASSSVRTDHMSTQLQTLLDLPTRFAKIHPDIMSKPLWKGRIPSGKLEKDGTDYPAEKGTYTSLPVTQQVIVEGYLCSNTHFCGKEGKCTYDRSLEVEKSIILHEEEHHPTHKSDSSSSSSPSATPTETQSSTEAPADSKECPVCRYMKNGPCKDQFIAWDTCLTSLQEGQELHDCFQQTKTMMFCMREHEYYDIMSAGTDFSKLEAADQVSQQPSSDASSTSTNHGESKQ